MTTVRQTNWCLAYGECIVDTEKEIDMKPGKVLCCIFLLAILGVDPAQNLGKYKRWSCLLI